MVTVTPGGGVPAPEGTPIPINKSDIEQAPVVEGAGQTTAPAEPGVDIAGSEAADKATLQRTQTEIAGSGVTPPAEVVAEEQPAPIVGSNAAEQGLGGNFAAAEAGIGNAPPVEPAPAAPAEPSPLTPEPPAPAVVPPSVAPTEVPPPPPKPVASMPVAEEMPQPPVVGADGAYDVQPQVSLELPEPSAAEGQNSTEVTLPDPELEEAKQLMVEKPGDSGYLRDFRAILRSRVSRIEEIQDLMVRIKTPALKETLGMNLVDAKEGLPRLIREIKRLENPVESSSSTGGQG